MEIQQECIYKRTGRMKSSRKSMCPWRAPKSAQGCGERVADVLVQGVKVISDEIIGPSPGAHL